MGQTALSSTRSIMGKPHTGLDKCPEILLSCFRDLMSDAGESWCNGDCFWSRNNKCTGRNETSSCQVNEIVCNFATKNCVREEAKCNFPYLFEGKVYDTCLVTNRGRSFCPPWAQATETKMWRRCSSSSCFSRSPPQPICSSRISGRPCLLPFTYNNSTYDGCLKDLDSKGKSWCPTIADIDGNPIKWEECNAYCPKVDPKTPVCMTEDSGGPCLFPYRYNNTG